MNVSRPVPYNPNGHEVLAAAAEVATSLDVDANFKLLPFQLQATPPPPRRSDSSPQMLRRPSPGSGPGSGCGPCDGGWSSVRTPVGRAGATSIVARALASEVTHLEAQVAVLRRQVALRDQVVGGLCGLLVEKG